MGNNPDNSLTGCEQYQLRKKEPVTQLRMTDFLKETLEFALIFAMTK